MQTRNVAVMGAGFAGLASALLLARDGHDVTLLERDALTVAGPAEAWHWPRKGIPHFLQPHAFTPRGDKELRDHLPDVHQALLDNGAGLIDLARKLPGERLPADDELRMLGVRRPLIEWALWRAVVAEPRVTIRSGVRVDGVRMDRGRTVAVAVDGADLDADVVVDALGRRSPALEWLAAAGITEEPVESSDCGVTYYCRYYRQRPGFDLPDGPWPVSPRGDLGYLGFSSFPGDNRTFAALLPVPPGVPEWRAFRNAAVFEAAVAQIPALRGWVDPDGVEPITDVLPMAGLRNTLRHYDPNAGRGLVPVGDALAHTDPVLSHGLPLALIHARELTTALHEHEVVDDALSQYAERTAPVLRERFDFATALDAQRLRHWLGESVDFTRRDGDYALFTFIAGGAAAMVDAEVFRVVTRRMGLLDSTSVLDDDLAMQQRIEDLFAEARSAPRPPSGPTRDEMVELVSTAT